jgi:hypothetical protein
MNIKDNTTLVSLLDQLANIYGDDTLQLKIELRNFFEIMKRELYAGLGGGNVGEIFWWPLETPPADSIIADGRDLSRIIYADLFDIIGIKYGEGDGETTFNVPDLRGQFIRGLDNGKGIDVNRELGSLQGDAIRNITGWSSHKSIPTNNGLGGGAIYGSWVNNGCTNSNYVTEAGVADVFDASRVVPTADENRPKNIALLPCIRYKPSIPKSPVSGSHTLQCIDGIMTWVEIL